MELIDRVHPQIQFDQAVAFVFLSQIPSFEQGKRHWLGNIYIESIFFIMSRSLAETIHRNCAVVTVLININRVHVDDARIYGKYRVSIHNHSVEGGVCRTSEMIFGGRSINPHIVSGRIVRLQPIGNGLTHLEITYQTNKAFR